MNVVVLSGGVGGARFLLGMREQLSGTGSEITAIVNVGDDMWHAGVRIAPDLDSVMYALAGVNDTERGWGRADETERVSGELRAYGVGWPWFTLGDLDLGTHLARTHYLREGLGLAEATKRISTRWPLGVTLIPSTDAEVETHVIVDGATMHFQEWWTRHRASIPALGFQYRAIEAAAPAPGVLDAIASADVIVIAPSNPVVSIGPILAIPGMINALRSASAPIVGVSPIIDGSVVRGMADACLTAIGVETSAGAVGLHYGSRSRAGLLDAWLVDETDAGSVAALESAGIRARAVPLWMRDPATSAELARQSLDVAR
jgi:LPPG:FO 2-phospho-L-lactate transferase